MNEQDERKVQYAETSNDTFVLNLARIIREQEAELAALREESRERPLSEHPETSEYVNIKFLDHEGWERWEPGFWSAVDSRWHMLATAVKQERLRSWCPMPAPKGGK